MPHSNATWATSIKKILPVNSFFFLLLNYTEVLVIPISLFSLPLRWRFASSFTKVCPAVAGPKKHVFGALGSKKEYSTAIGSIRAAPRYRDDGVVFHLRRGAVRNGKAEVFFFFWVVKAALVYPKGLRLPYPYPYNRVRAFEEELLGHCRGCVTHCLVRAIGARVVPSQQHVVPSLLVASSAEVSGEKGGIVIVYHLLPQGTKIACSLLDMCL